MDPDLGKKRKGEPIMQLERATQSMEEENTPSGSEEENAPVSSEKIEQVKELGTTKAKKSIQILNIIGQIEGHTIVPPQSKATKYEHVIPVLTDVEQNDDIQGLLVIMNTVGGDVEAGADPRHEQALGFPCAGRRPQHWGAAGGEHRFCLYCAHCQHDDSPPAHHRAVYHRAAEF